MVLERGEAAHDRTGRALGHAETILVVDQDGRDPCGEGAPGVALDVIARVQALRRARPRSAQGLLEDGALGLLHARHGRAEDEVEGAVQLQCLQQTRQARAPVGDQSDREAACAQLGQELARPRVQHEGPRILEAREQTRGQLVEAGFRQPEMVDEDAPLKRRNHSSNSGRRRRSRAAGRRERRPSGRASRLPRPPGRGAVLPARRRTAREGRSTGERVPEVEEDGSEGQGRCFSRSAEIGGTRDRCSGGEE
jgi:hypothetical protein